MTLKLRLRSPPRAEKPEKPKYMTKEDAGGVLRKCTICDHEKDLSKCFAISRHCKDGSIIFRTECSTCNAKKQKELILKKYQDHHIKVFQEFIKDVASKMKVTSDGDLLMNEFQKLIEV